MGAAQGGAPAAMLDEGVGFGCSHAPSLRNRPIKSGVGGGGVARGEETANGCSASCQAGRGDGAAAKGGGVSVWPRPLRLAALQSRVEGGEGACPNGGRRRMSGASAARLDIGAGPPRRGRGLLITPPSSARSWPIPSGGWDRGVASGCAPANGRGGRGRGLAVTWSPRAGEQSGAEGEGAKSPLIWGGGRGHGHAGGVQQRRGGAGSPSPC